jgi:nucleoside-diphosphate-sugar epimerase
MLLAGRELLGEVVPALAQAEPLEHLTRASPAKPDDVAAIFFAYWFDIGAARRDLGYEPAVSLEEGLERLGLWLRAHDGAGTPGGGPAATFPAA